MLNFQHENRVFTPKTPKNLEAPRKLPNFALSKGNDGIWAQGTKNLLSGLAKFTACPERKKRSREWRQREPLNIKH